MSGATTFKPSAIRTTLDVCLGKAEIALGRLVHVKQGQREFSQFAYHEARLVVGKLREFSLPLFDMHQAAKCYFSFAQTNIQRGSDCAGFECRCA